MMDLMRETEDVALKRKACREMKELLQRALEIVNEVRDFNTFKQQRNNARAELANFEYHEEQYSNTWLYW